jgi:hypothetical protein
MDVLIIITTAVFGVFLGAQLAEAMLLVPYWKSLSADQFHGFYSKYGDAIHRFFAPLTIASTVLPIILLLLAIYSSDNRLVYLIVLLFCVLMFFGSFFVYFKKANQQFKDGSLKASQLSGALKSWGRWHWMRVCFESIAFIILLVL